jgi:hypothetical protein
VTANVYADMAIWFVVQFLIAFLVYRFGWMRRGRHDQKELLEDVDGTVLATVTVHVMAPQVIDGEVHQGGAIRVNAPEAFMALAGPAPALAVAHDAICRSLAEFAEAQEDGEGGGEDHLHPGTYL